MLPGIGKIDPRKMQQMMKQMGIKQEEIDANRVIIEKNDGRIIIENANITKVVMSEQESWQIIGEAHEESSEGGIKEEDVKLVMEKTGKSEEEVRRILEEVKGDIAEAIVKLQRIV